MSLVGGIFQDMAPSMPPGFDDGQVQKPGNPGFHWRWHSHGWNRVNWNTFVPVFIVFFAVILWTRWRGDPGTGRLHKVARALGENWFHVIVGNAFGAMVTSLVAVWVQQFSWVQFAWHSVMQFIMPAVHRLLEFIFAPGSVNGIDSWLDWFGQNQARFDFWIIYLAAICDDLGVPSIKTLGRWLWGRIRETPGSKLQSNSHQSGV